MVWTILMAVLAAISFIYGILVLRIGSGTGFFLVWFFIGGVFLLLSAAAKWDLWSKISGTVRALILIVLLVCISVFAFTEIKIGSGFQSRTEPDLDYLIVLGAQVKESGPSAVLKYRLDAACEYLNDNPGTVCILSGGRGPNEPWAEAEGMCDYMTAKGIPESRIILEKESLNTKQNIENCLNLSKDGGGLLIDPEHDRIGIVTNNFHIFRGVSIAKKAGAANVFGIPAYSRPLYLPNNMLREFFGVVKDFLAGNI